MKLKQNPLKHTLRCLASSIVLRTQETIDRETGIAKEERAEKSALKRNDPIVSNANIHLKREDSSTGIEPRKPKTSPSTLQKRNVSDTSFGSRSPNTTPKKLKKPETHVQHLQNMLVSEILDALYDNDNVRIDWARGRNLRLFYGPYISIMMYSKNRSNETYFKCCLPDNQTDIPDKVIAIADGALWFMTDKESNPSSQCIWHKQSTCLPFEVLSLL
jgi:hypothetical protein